MILASAKHPAPSPPNAMYQNTEHPEHDADMELLCSLPVEPAGVTLDSLCKDFGLRLQHDMHAMCHRLRDHGFRVSISNWLGKGRVMAIEKKGSREAFAAANNYWKTVYGD